MRAQKIIVLFYLIMVSGCFVSCEKENDKTASCRILTATTTNGTITTVHRFTYDNEGKVSTINVTGSETSSKVFNYSGNTIIINTTTPGGSSRDSLTVDGQGRLLNFRRYTTGVPGYTNSSFFYNGEDLVRGESTTQSNTTPSTISFINKNGNVVREEGTGYTTTMEYYENEKVQNGDWMIMLGITFFGHPVYPQKNLIKTYQFGQRTISNFSYEKNSDGLIRQVTVTSSGSVGTITYEYECD